MMCNNTGRQRVILNKLQAHWPYNEEDMLIKFYDFLFVCFWFWLVGFGCTARHVELPQPGIEPMPPAVEAWSVNHWITKEVQNFMT